MRSLEFIVDTSDDMSSNDLGLQMPTNSGQPILHANSDTGTDHDHEHNSKADVTTVLIPVGEDTAHHDLTKQCDAQTLAGGLVSYRPDIDGLRGFGALLVLFFHFRETWSDAAYKGADLTNSTFFAVSGFVITLSVLRSRAKNPSQIDLCWTSGFALVFLFRRLQRLILPQLLVIFVTVVVFCGSLTPCLRLVSLLQTAKWSVVGGANIYFGTQKVDTQYVQDETTDLSLSRNPLMHMWYLGVEEQVYLIYPWMFAAAHVLGAHLPAGVYMVFGVVFTISLVCALSVDVHSGPGFFLLQYRGWEVLVGVLTCHALVMTRAFWDKAAENDQFQRRALIWPQLLFVVMETSAGCLFQYPEYSLTATMCGLAGTVTFFIAGHGFDWENIYLRPLNEMNFCDVPMLNYIYGLRGCAYFGRISYAVYLWHFPINVLCADYKEDIQRLIGSTDTAAFSMQFLLIVVLSIVTHHFIENPFRFWRVIKWPPLPALCVVLLAVGLELWLIQIYEQMTDADLANIVRPPGMELPPLFGKAEVAGYLAAILLTVLLAAVWRICTTSSLSLPNPECARWLFAAVLFLLGVYMGRVWGNADPLTMLQSASLKPNGSSVLHAPCSTFCATEDRLTTKCKWSGCSGCRECLVGNATPAPPEYFWNNWRKGTHSFASNGCACRNGNAVMDGDNVTLDATSAPDLPLCFDVGRWAAEPQETYKARTEKLVKTEGTDCAGASTDGKRWNGQGSAEEIWQHCRVSGRRATDGSTRETSTAFVFGSSTGQWLRHAVAGAIGGEFAMLGFALPMFEQPELLQLLMLDRASDKTQDLGGGTDKPRIHFDEGALPVLTYPVKSSVEQFTIRTNKLKYIQLLGDLLGQHLGEGDLIFYPFLPIDESGGSAQGCIDGSGSAQEKVKCLSHKKADYLCCSNSDGLNGPQMAGLARLGAIAQARGATLVLTTGLHRVSKKLPEHLHLEDLLHQEKPLRELAAKESSVVAWSFARHLCGAIRCSNQIPNTTMKIVIKDWDWRHPSLQAQAYVAPFLCNFLKKTELLQPRKYHMRLAHDQLHIDMAKMRKGEDQYKCRVFQMPAHLRRSAIVNIEMAFQPKSHRHLVHHTLIRHCTSFPTGNGNQGHNIPPSAVGEPFECNPQYGWINECYTMVWAMGMEAQAINLPTLPTGEQMAAPVDAEFLMVEVHYKAPQVNVGNAGLRQELQRLQHADTVVDSSGLSVTFLSQEEANNLGTTLKLVQLLEIGPRDSLMLNLPPGVANQKVTNVCPRECFAAALEVAKLPHIEILSVWKHAHVAATAMFSEVVDASTNTSTVFSAIPNYPMFLAGGEQFEMLPNPVPITRDHTVRVTCVYNTTGRHESTSLGESLKDEMCFMYTIISPPVQGFHQCWHLDKGLSHLNPQQDANTRRLRKSPCWAQCGSLSFPEFKLARGSSQWSSPDSEGGQLWHNQREGLGTSWPGAPVCET